MTRKLPSQGQRRRKSRPGALGRALPVGAFAVMLLGAAFVLLAPEFTEGMSRPTLVSQSVAAPVGDSAKAAVASTGVEADDEPTANPFIGEWRGSGWVARSDGKREQLNCRASHRTREKGERTVHVLRCANERFQIDLTSGLTHRGTKISGWWREASHNRQGGLSGTQSGDKLSLHMRGENMTASLQATIKGCRQSIGIRITEERDRKGFVSLEKVGC